MGIDVIIFGLAAIIAIGIKILKYSIIKNATRVCRDCKNFSNCERFKYYCNRQKERHCLEHPACKEFQEGRK
ncbi:MAG: hypothetical protein RR523_01685 [Cetobacterium sp.]|uniref:hypothetical protein n=1 Tax=Cetobacterium sp. TaxID=2071632 RepID=UPI002FC594F5